jgi:hypothetical protein
VLCNTLAKLLKERERDGDEAAGGEGHRAQGNPGAAASPSVAG